MEIFQIYIYSLLTVFCCCAYSLPEFYESTGDNSSPFYSSKNFDLDKKKTKEVANYLSQYGYTPTYTEDMRSLKESIKDLQYFGGLVVTGELDATTEQLMNTNRCGLKDPDVRGKRLSRGGRHRRYNHQGSTWNKDVLTWRYKHDQRSRNAWRPDNPDGLSEDEIRAVMRKAMDKWEEYTNIVFVEDRKATNPDIWVLFVSGKHNDPFRFDGRGGTLAHAFYPLNNKGLAGDVHFDDAETFTIGYDPGNNGRDLMWVAVHELGHTLGLDHSRVQEAVMSPWYKGYKENMELEYDDILGIQKLYGGKDTTTKPKKNIPDHKRCPRSPITALWDFNTFNMAISEDEKLYVIRRNGRSRMIQANIPAKNYFRIPYTIDAVLQTNLGQDNGIVHNIIFTNEWYYIYNNFVQKSGPHSIHTISEDSPLKLGFPTSVKRIDAAMKWWVNQKVYFFSGHQYWRYDEETKQLEAGYPRPISSGWLGIPSSDIGSAYSSSERKETLFTKGDKIYRIKERPRPMKLYPGYPRSINLNVLRCEEE